MDLGETLKKFFFHKIVRVSIFLRKSDLFENFSFKI